MFDLLTNILIWIIAIPIFIILFRTIPKDWFRLFGLVVFTIVIAIIFANFQFVEDPIPKVVVEFFTFPFTLIGILLLLLFVNYWFRLKGLKIKSGDKVDNKSAADKTGVVTKELLLAFLILAIASNNATSELFICYLEQQGVNASIQSHAQDSSGAVANLSQQELLNFKQGVYDIIIVLAENHPYEPRLQEAIKLWNLSEQQKPYIILSGGRHTTYPPTKGYPCFTAPESPPNRTKDDVREAIASTNYGLHYDPRYESYFINPKNPGFLSQIDLTEADRMCAIVTDLPNMAEIRSSIILEPSGKTVRNSGEEIRKTIGFLEKNKLIRKAKNRRIFLITSPIEATRVFLSFKNQELNASLKTTSYPSDSHSDISKQCPWPIGKEFTINPKYFLFSAASFNKSETVWTEIKELLFYTLRFWLRPPLSSGLPYFPQ